MKGKKIKYIVTVTNLMAVIAFARSRTETGGIYTGRSFSSGVRGDSSAFSSGSKPSGSSRSVTVPATPVRSGNGISSGGTSRSYTPSPPKSTFRPAPARAPVVASPAPARAPVVTPPAPARAPVVASPAPVTSRGSSRTYTPPPAPVRSVPDTTSRVTVPRQPAITSGSGSGSWRTGGSSRTETAPKNPVVRVPSLPRETVVPTPPTRSPAPDTGRGNTTVTIRPPVQAPRTPGNSLAERTPQRTVDDSNSSGLTPAVPPRSGLITKKPVVTTTRPATESLRPSSGSYSKPLDVTARRPLSAGPSVSAKLPSRQDSDSGLSRPLSTKPLLGSRPSLTDASKPDLNGTGAPGYAKPAPSVRLSRPSPRYSSSSLSRLPLSQPSAQSLSGARSGVVSGIRKKPVLPSSRLHPDNASRESGRISGNHYSPDSLLRNRRPSGDWRVSDRTPYSSSRHYSHDRYSPHHYPYDRHSHHHYDRYPRYRYNRYACSPVWWGPVVYPAGLGFTWWDDHFSISFSTYGPSYYSCYTPYYNSWYYGGCGYTSVYYGGWRHGWYGGLSYVCNPWPVYRTYYLYEPEPIIIERPVIVQKEIIVQERQPYVAETTAIQTTPISYSSGYPSDHIVVEERTTIRSAAESGNPAEFDPEYVYEDQFDPYYYDGDYLYEELTIGFASYATTLNPESIWISYSGLDLLY